MNQSLQQQEVVFHAFKPGGEDPAGDGRDACPAKEVQRAVWRVGQADVFLLEMLDQEKGTWKDANRTVDAQGSEGVFEARSLFRRSLDEEHHVESTFE